MGIANNVDKADVKNGRWTRGGQILVKLSRTRKEIKDKLKTIDDCLDFLEKIALEGNVIDNIYWDAAEERYQKLAGISPDKKYATRYRKIIDIVDKKHNQMIMDMHQENYPPGVRREGESFPGEFRETFHHSVSEYRKVHYGKNDD